MASTIESMDDIKDEVQQKIHQQEQNNVPVCPYCGQDPCLVSTRGPIQLGPIQAVAVFCGNSKCRKMFSVIPIGMAAPRVIPAMPKVIIPGKG